ncbi:anthranilate phosphoribosyltransferase [Tribonema minus]|uniref:anthranilate phosphoribosyltransferase n=1 Tax=Tribonema minus TaxID=303371 RepID=A0A835ZCJ6_9STRA|nr:anthranilate phosphoribosyltransferase [Tribonema minus]
MAAAVGMQRRRCAVAMAVVCAAAVPARAFMGAQPHIGATLRSSVLAQARHQRPPARLHSSLKPYLEKLIAGQDLAAADTEDAWVQIMQGAAPTEQVAALLCLLRAKGETSTELAGCVRGMKASCVPVHVDGALLDIVGTGGDGADTINVSTASAVLAAAAGARVCKFGNRSVSSMCGSADVLEALGISVELTPTQVERCCQEAGVAFMYAPTHYPAMKNVAPVRKALGVRTAFNILGPMTSPAGAQHVVIGVFQDELMPLMAGALREVGYVERGVIVHGCGLDEVSPLGASHIIELRNTAPPGEPKMYETTEYTLDPLDYGFPRCTIDDLKGGDRDENARLFRETLAGGARRDAKRDAVVLNAGMGLYVYGAAPTLEAAFALARETLEAGGAARKLEEWIAASKRVCSQ